MAPRIPSPDAGERFVELLTVMKRLRGEGGCPWDREQTRESLRPFLVEETHEVLDALDGQDPAALGEELGDLLFQVVFHAEIAEENGEFTMAGLLSSLVAKMIRRHPHVFGDRSVDTPAEALAQWEAIKRQEGEGSPRSALEGVPRSLPGLMRAQRVQHRAARVGFAWPEPGAAIDKAREELAEAEEAIAGGDHASVERELGDLLFAVVGIARLVEVDPERALQGAVERFRERFRHLEGAAATESRPLAAMTLEEMERRWTETKARERPP